MVLEQGNNVDYSQLRQKQTQQLKEQYLKEVENLTNANKVYKTGRTSSIGLDNIAQMI